MSQWTDEYEDRPFSGVEPKPTTAKVVGILNIVFGGLLILCGLCMGLYVLMFASMGPMMAAQGPQLQRQIEQARQKQIRELERQEQAARTDQEKKQIRD